MCCRPQVAIYCLKLREILALGQFSMLQCMAVVATTESDVPSVPISSVLMSHNRIPVVAHLCSECVILASFQDNRSHHACVNNYSLGFMS